MTKVNRAIAKSSNRLLDKAFIERKHFVVRLEENKFIEVIRGTPDFARLKKCFEQITLGLFFHEFNKRFKGTTTVLMAHLEQKDKNGETFIRFIKHRAELELRAKERLGNNPAVFCYQFSDPDRFGLFILKMLFYGGCEIFVSFIPEGRTPPFNLGMQMIEGGIKTVIEPIELLLSIPPKLTIKNSSSADFFELCVSQDGTVISPSRRLFSGMSFCSGKIHLGGTCSLEVAGLSHM